MAIADLVYIDATGYHFPDYPTVLAMMQDDYRSIYGADIYIDPDSQDGEYIAIQARAIYDCLALGAAVYNAYSPSTAQGVGLSRNVKINGIDRRAATFSTVDLVLVGGAGTLILNGQAQDQIDQKWNLPASVLIPDSGTTTVTATAELPGAIVGVSNSINKIATPTRGWQTVNNPAPAATGVAAETDFELRRRQAVSTALPSLSVLDGTLGAVANVDGVTRYRAYENDTNATDADGIPAHSISIVAEGGDGQSIANAIAIHKTPGTGTYGTTTFTTYDEYGIPNDINFYRPTLVPIEVEITADALQGYTSAYEDVIKQAVADYINGIQIGGDVLWTKLFTPANLGGTVAGATFDIDTLKISRGGAPVAAANVVIAFNEAASSVIADISVVVT